MINEALMDMDKTYTLKDTLKYVMDNLEKLASQILLDLPNDMRKKDE